MATFNQNLYKAIELHWEKHNTVPSADRLAEILSVPLDQIEDAFDDEDFIKVLRASYLYDYYVSAPGELSLSQLNALRVFSNQHDRSTLPQKLKKLKITSQQFNRWMQDPVFSRTLNSRVQQSFKDNGWQVFQSLLDQASKGDFNSTKLYMEMAGHYTPSNRLHSTNVNVSVKSVDLLIEVILRVLGPLPNGSELISRITTGFEEVLTTGSLRSEELEIHSPAVPQLSSPVSLTDTDQVGRISPVDAPRSSGKLAQVEAFLAQVEDDLGI